MPTSTPPGGPGARERRLRVVHLRPQDDHVEVMFVESARIYRLERANPMFDAALSALRAALADKQAAWVLLARPEGELIEAVRLDAGRSK